MGRGPDEKATNWYAGRRRPRAVEWRKPATDGASYTVKRRMARPATDGLVAHQVHDAIRASRQANELQAIECDPSPALDASVCLI